MSELTNEQKKVIKNEVKQALKEKEKTKKTWAFTIKEEVPKVEKIASVFAKFEFLSMEPERKESVVIQLKADAKWDRLYWIVIFLSGIIATLGLLNNSVAVVIWAMLIAPLLRPINWLSYAIARGGSKSFSESARCLLFSVIIPVTSAYILTKILWVYSETPEILARISPNILDFFIAAFSAAVAILSLRFEKLSESIAWVALAASLMPPLAVIGIELAFWNVISAFGAFTLFLANLWAIIFVSIIFLWLYWYTPHHSKLQKQSFKRVSFVMGWIIIILIPLCFSFNAIKHNAELTRKVDIVLEQNTSTVFYDYSLSDIYIKNGEKHIDIVLRLKQWTDMTSEIDALKQQLQLILKNTEVISTLEIKYVDVF